ncbi:carboxypeptidase regulatory-like domain-containing protein [Candidatus Kaiserbacteria bacterium]|nr:carboxypeptidase regulatory-like domain-containing protein [Candidatus Kaiserbacteria bacterium]
MRRPTHTRGLTLVELLITSAISVTIFAALFGSFQYTLGLMEYSKAKLSALSLANDRMEYFRSLPYNDVGTLSGIPSGVIPQNSTSTLNGIDFSERVLVEYVDDAADGKDGTATPDSNGIPADYKRIKLEYTWLQRGKLQTVSLVSNIVPNSIESTAGGGTVRINVLDNQSNFLPGASVRLINNTTTSTIDITRYSDASGVALFSGAPAASNYQVIVNGIIGGETYSTDQTYEATTTNPSPAVAPFAVLESDISTLTFQIGALSDLNIQLLSGRTDDAIIETFTGIGLVASTTNVSTSTGSLQLADTAGVYKTAGVAYVGPISPATLSAWQIVHIAATTPNNTAVLWHAYTYSGGVFTLVPDSDLAQNNSGFSSVVGSNGIIESIAKLDSSVYPEFYVGIELRTSNTSVSPSVDEVGVYYRESSIPTGTISFGLKGTKQIGTQLDLTPIYKVDITTTTNSVGAKSISDLEFDQYTVVPAGSYDIAMACAAHPIIHQAGIDSDVELLLVSNAAHTLRVQVEDSYGRPVPGATVKLTRTGYSSTITTDGCGQAFFSGGVTSNSDYTVTISATGFTTKVIPSFTIDGDTVTVESI